jgi:hypothetical protein
LGAHVMVVTNPLLPHLCPMNCSRLHLHS